MGPKADSAKNELKLSELEFEMSDLSGDIKETRDLGADTGNDPSKLSLFRARLSRLDSTFNRFLSCAKEANALAKLLEQDSATMDTLRTQTRTYYYDALSFGATGETQVADQSLVGDISHVHSNPHIKLPTINLPRFSGNISEWFSFKDTFVSLINQNVDLSDTQRFHYLKSALSGAALQAISTIPITSDGYAQAWASLLKKYDNKRIQATNCLMKIFSFKPMAKSDLKSLNHFSETVLEGVACFKKLNLPDPSGFILLTYGLRLLDAGSRDRFETEIGSKTEIPTFEEFAEFIHLKCIQLQANSLTSNMSANSQSEPSSKQPKITRHVLVSSESSSASNICPICSERHRLFRCTRFRSLNPNKRFQQVKRLSLCLNCLSSSHSVGKCTSSSSCFHCSQRHHSLLHFPTSAQFSSNRSKSNVSTKSADINIPADTNSADSSPDLTKSKPDSIRKTESASSKDAVLSSSCIDNVPILLGTATARMPDHTGRYIPVRLLIDSGAQRSFISASFADKLGLKQHPNAQPLRGLGDSPIGGGDSQVQCTLVPKDKLFPQLRTNAVVVPKIIGKVPTYPLPSYVVGHFKSYHLADDDFGKPGSIDFLLGADLFPQIINGECINSNDYPSALRTILGWVIIGPIAHKCDSQSESLALMATDQPKEIDSILTKFWELETVPQINTSSPEDLIAEKHFLSTHSRDHSGRYIVRLPFKDQTPPKLGNSYNIALNRFRRLEFKLDKTPLLKENYSKIVEEYLESGYISNAISETKYFLPHHCVVKDSPTTKLRLVFDASSRTDNGSLNDHLLIGPKLQLDIHQVLLKFRMFPFVIASDICQMYLQILLHPDDIPYQHFLYRFNSSEPLACFQLNRLAFGLSCSPFLAIRVVRQLVQDEGAPYPMASAALLNNIYVDDVLAGADTLEDAQRLRDELIELLGKGGFVLKKWTSNAPQLLNGICGNNQEVLPFAEPDHSSVKLLGMQWDPTYDILSYNIQNIALTFTKRGIMSAVARMYDPLGYLAPVVFKAKSYLQQLWSLRLGWDDPIPIKLTQEYETFFRSLPLLRSVKIPRCIFPQKPVHIMLVGFCDASSVGYAATMYLRVQPKIGLTQSYLIVSKTRLAPLKTVTIPRLELCAALLLIQTWEAISNFLDQFSVDKVCLFSDSTVVLSWLRLSPHSLKTFVANRVSRILNKSSVSEWHHVGTRDNPADLASRGLMPEDLIDNDFWWNGPKWLNDEFYQWPVCHQFSPIPVPELKPNVVLINQTSTLYFIQVMERFSSFTKLQRIFAYVLRFVNNLRSPLNARKNGHLTLPELGKATSVLIKCVQHQYFPRDSCMLDKKLQSLSPFSDTQGILRVGGRLRNSTLPFNAKHPILIPPKAHLTKLIVDDCHRSYLHAGPQLLLSLLRRVYWIVSGRTLIRSTVHKCVKCYRFRTNNFTPRMADLPPSRFEQVRPFIVTGIDFAGPFTTKESNRKKSIAHKSYVCLFVCLSTRAVHLELVSQLTTDALLACINRFISRRGLPSKILSDNGTNFVGAARHIKELYSWLNREEVRQAIISHSHYSKFEWEFIPPSAPHFGGLWEAGVKSFKYHFYRVVKDRILTFEEFSTLLTRIEAVLNSRPLYPLSSSPDDFDVLTPGHFIIGTPLVALPEPDLDDVSMNRLTRWQLLNKCTQDIWKRWRRDYLNSLQQRTKWTQQTDNVQLDSLVLLREPKLPPLQWPTGRIVETFPGSDGIVRVVKLKTPTGEYTRPVSKLAPLLSSD